MKKAMKQEQIQRLVKKWIREDESSKAKWEVYETEKDSTTVVVTGNLVIHFENQSIEVCGTCPTENNDESIGRAIQAINEGIMKKLQAI